MRFSWSTQKWQHSERFPGHRKAILENLLAYYEASSKTFSLNASNEDSFSFNRGRKWVSRVALGSETWCYHTVLVEAEEVDDETNVTWNIDLKLCGLQIGKNALIEECKGLAKAFL